MTPSRIWWLALDLTFMWTGSATGQSQPPARCSRKVSHWLKKGGFETLNHCWKKRWSKAAAIQTETMSSFRDG